MDPLQLPPLLERGIPMESEFCPPFHKNPASLGLWAGKRSAFPAWASAKSHDDQHSCKRWGAPPSGPVADEKRSRCQAPSRRLNSALPPMMALREFLIHGVNSVSPTHPGAMTRWIPTAHTAFFGRGGGDYLGSHDREDLVAVNLRSEHEEGAGRPAATGHENRHQGAGVQPDQLGIPSAGNVQELPSKAFPPRASALPFPLAPKW